MSNDPKELPLYGQPDLYNSGHCEVPQMARERVKHANQMFWIRMVSIMCAVIVAIASGVAIMAATINLDQQVNNKAGTTTLEGHVGPTKLAIHLSNRTFVVSNFTVAPTSAVVSSSFSSSVNTSVNTSFAVETGTITSSPSSSTLFTATIHTSVPLFPNTTDTMSALTLPGSVIGTAVSTVGPFIPIPLITGTVGVVNSTSPISAGTGIISTTSYAPFGNGTIFPGPTASPTRNATATSTNSTECTNHVVTVTVTKTESTSASYDEISPFTTYTVPSNTGPAHGLPIPSTTTYTPTITDLVTSNVGSLEIVTIFESISGTIVPATTVTMVDGHPPFPTGNGTVIRNGTIIGTGFGTPTGSSSTGEPTSTDLDMFGFPRHDASSGSRPGLSTIAAVAAIAVTMLALW